MSVKTWDIANQRYLAASLAIVRNALAHYIARLHSSSNSEELQAQQKELQQALDEAVALLPAPSAITRVCEAFDLSPFERDILLLCAGIELDGRFVALCAAAQGRSWDEQHGGSGGATTIPVPTFSLALAALSGAHWDALTPIGPLRHWRLISIGMDGPLTFRPLRIDERVLHYLTGTTYTDERLSVLSLVSGETRLLVRCQPELGVKRYR